MDKLIGIVISKRDNVSTGINNAYITFFEQFGEVMFINPLVDRTFELDLLVLPGGADVLPFRYNEKPHRLTGKPNLDAEYFDMNTLPQYIAMGTPIVGICRGGQSLNVHFGGKLTQHHDYVTSSKSRAEAVDDLYITDYGTGLFNSIELNVGNYKVNSIHHQGWYYDQVAEGFNVMAIHKTERNVEMMYNQKLKILAVQYHPEEMNCQLVSNIITNLMLK